MIRAYRPAAKLPTTLTVSAVFEGIDYEAIYHPATGNVQVRTGNKQWGTCRWDGRLAGSAGDLPEGAYPVLEEALAVALYS